ncbi:ribosome biogenesis protein tsr1 [Friedmanniomyces endolithicus]|nr:ribosome biogenesis protein tsr1 [Friedmanniomyces endolithicus]
MASTVPFRFKAGTTAMTPSSDHHHRSATKASNKPFKTRHASKSALKERSKGKVGQFERGVRKTLHQQMSSKIDRRNHAKQLRQNKLGERREEGSVFTGKDGAPRIVAVVALCGDVNSTDVMSQLNGSVDAEESGHYSVEVPRFKTRMQYLLPERTDLFAVLDACRAADYVLFVLSAEEEVDQLGEQMLRCVESQGISTVLTGAYGLDRVEPAKKRPDVLKSLRSYINHFFAAQEKVHDMSSRQDCSNVMRSLCTTTPKGIRWREDRSWMYVEGLRWENEQPVVTGTIRGRSLKADRLVGMEEWGTFQIEKITAAPAEGRSSKRVKIDDMAVDAERTENLLEQPSQDQDDLAELAPEEAMMDDEMTMPTASLAASDRKHVLLDDHQYFDEDEEGELAPPRRVPHGTSKYQTAWYLGDNSDSGSDMEDIEDHEGDMDVGGLASAGPADGHFDDVTMGEPTEGAPTTYAQSEMFPDAAPEDEAEQIAAYRKQRREEAKEDLEFPDEIELSPHVNARERLARYRGLKSFRNSAWDTDADRLHQPEEWSRLLEISDYKSAKNRVMNEALVGGVKAGTRVNVYLRLTPGQTREQFQAMSAPIALFSLLRHEHKRTAVNASITLSSDYGAPLRSKEELIMQCGPRRLVINPLFSQAGNTPNNVHKFDRYLHPGRTAVASIIGPVIWGSVPCLYFRRRAPSTAAPSSDAIEALTAVLPPSTNTTDLDLIATGTTLPPSSPSTHNPRIIAKRIILSGHPYKIHKKLVTVRYMFFSDEDVEYFKALQLWTKRGRQGFVKEALGTHGYFKATFDGKVGPLDAVGRVEGLEEWWGWGGGEGRGEGVRVV